MSGGWPKPNPEFLKKMREVTKETNVILLFDEVVTGFRTCFGGAQDRWGVVPDMATFGKIIGGGLPLAAVVGKREILDVAVTSGDPAEDVTTKVHTIGTNAGKHRVWVSQMSIQGENNTQLIQENRERLKTR
jgi:glutamate-1-semialdehyde 2,1-aminomutase